MTDTDVLNLLSALTGGITFRKCGLDKSENFLHPSEDILSGSIDEIEEYCTHMLEACPHSRCAVFIISLSGNITAAVKFNMDDFDIFELDNSWHYWDLQSLAEGFNIDACGILSESADGVWHTVTE